MIFSCCDKERLRRVRDHPALNGIDHLEVVPWNGPAGLGGQRTLLVHLVKTPQFVPAAENVTIEGGERVPSVAVEWLAMADAVPVGLGLGLRARAYLDALPNPDRILVIRTVSAGDFSNYTLHLTEDLALTRPFTGFDPVLCRIAFSFKIECDTDFDCAPECDCPDEIEQTPALNYLAKDYEGLRRLMLDRLGQIMPDWRERNPADLGIVMVEMLSYVGDHLSQAQDRAAMEAYFFKANSRISVRRHARLPGYHMHDGHNSRAFIHIRVAADLTIPASQLQFLTQIPGAPARLPADWDSLDAVRQARPRPLIFEPLRTAPFGSDPAPGADQLSFATDLNELKFYTWGDSGCCLREGATRATFQGHHPQLEAGQILIFEERLGPKTGQARDANPFKRHAVRLTQVATDLNDPVTEPPTPITEIGWHHDDALPFAICISSQIEEALGGGIAEDVSIALGNIIVADHGRTIEDEDLGVVPNPHLEYATGGCDHCDPRERLPVPVRYRPRLARMPLTHSAPLAPDRPATAVLKGSVRQALPQIVLNEAETGRAWRPRRDLLNSGPLDRAFVAELEDDLTAKLRFASGSPQIAQQAAAPVAGTKFMASYRIGNGIAGNIGADAIAHVATSDTDILAVRNPLPSQGGMEPETKAEARRAAPYAFRQQRRAVTAADYERRAMSHPKVQSSAATFRWVGFRHAAFTSVDPYSASDVDQALAEEIHEHIEPYRMAGYDLKVEAARKVALELALMICVCPDHFQAHVRRDLIAALGAGMRPDGQLGVFHPDRFQLGGTVYLSPIYAAAARVAGVQSVAATRFHRLGQPSPFGLYSGYLRMGRLEIPVLDNDPNRPERGVLRIRLQGGK